MCVVLAISSIYFTKDAQDMVLDPLERMIEKVKIIASNPMSAATDEVNLAGVYSFADTDIKKQKNMKMRRSKKGNNSVTNVADEQTEEAKSDDEIDEKDLYETEVLERAIVKIGYLLALGFGEAGASIIG